MDYFLGVIFARIIAAVDRIKLIPAVDHSIIKVNQLECKYPFIVWYAIMKIYRRSVDIPTPPTIS